MDYKKEAAKRYSKIKDKEVALSVIKDMLKTMYGLKDDSNRNNFAVNFDFERKVLNEMFEILSKEE